MEVDVWSLVMRMLTVPNSVERCWRTGEWKRMMLVLSMVRRMARMDELKSLMTRKSRQKIEFVEEEEGKSVVLLLRMAIGTAELRVGWKRWRESARTEWWAGIAGKWVWL